MTEAEVYEKFVKSICRNNKIYVQRFEHLSVPDVYMSKNNFVLWGELKVCERSRGWIKPDWRPGQLAWIRRQASYGNKNICLILWYDGEVYWLPPQENYKPEELVCQKNHYLAELNKV